MFEKPYRLALFDVCHTLIGMTTISDFTEHFLLSPNKNPRFSIYKWFIHFLYKVLRKLKLINSEVYRNHYIKLLSGCTREELEHLSGLYLNQRLRWSLKKDILERLKLFQKDGYKVFLVSAGFDVYLRDFAKFLGVELVCTVADIDEFGVCTGRIRGLDCFGINKVSKIQAEIPFYQHCDLVKSIAFSDDVSDIPMLSMVGSACVVDPSGDLESYSKNRGWEIVKTGFLSPYTQSSHYFVVRDDDLNFFSTPKDIEGYYGELFAMNIPVNFSAIPCIGLASDAWGPLLDMDKNNLTRREFPISDNKNLTEYVKKNNLIEILQHGYNHETHNGIFEYLQKNGLFETTLLGKQELEKAFGCKIETFVPPHDQISNHGIKVLEDLKLNLIRSRGFRNFFPTGKYINGIIIMTVHKLRYAFRDFFPAYPFVINFGGHKEAYSNRISLNFDELNCRLIDVKNRGGVFIIVDHMHEKVGGKREVLLRLIQEARKHNFRFVKASDLFKINSV